MDLDNIREIVNNYNKLITLTEEKIKIIETLDVQYNTARRIEDISIGEDTVYVTCDDTCMGCYDTRSFSFPTQWLAENDEELKKIVIMEKELRIEREREEREKRQLKIKQDREEEDIKQYERLKKKFEK